MRMRVALASGTDATTTAVTNGHEPRKIATRSASKQSSDSNGSARKQASSTGQTHQFDGDDELASTRPAKFARTSSGRLSREVSRPSPNADIDLEPTKQQYLSDNNESMNGNGISGDGRDVTEFESSPEKLSKIPLDSSIEVSCTSKPDALPPRLRGKRPKGWHLRKENRHLRRAVMQASPVRSDRQDSIETQGALRLEPGGVLKRLPGRRRAPHPDSSIEAAMRRQLELKIAYRAVAKALKPVLAEVAERTQTALENNEDFHRQYEKFEVIIDALDGKLKERLDILSHEEEFEHKRVEGLFEAEQEIIIDAYNIQLDDVRSQNVCRRQEDAISLLRNAQQELDSEATDDEDGVIPRQYCVEIENGERRPLDTKYESRSRWLIETQNRWDDLGTRTQWRESQRRSEPASLVTAPKDAAVYNLQHRSVARAELNILKLLDASLQVDTQAARDARRISNAAAIGLQALAAAVGMPKTMPIAAAPVDLEAQSLPQTPTISRPLAFVTPDTKHLGPSTTGSSRSATGPTNEKMPRKRDEAGTSYQTPTSSRSQDANTFAAPNGENAQSTTRKGEGEAENEHLRRYSSLPFVQSQSHAADGSHDQTPKYESHGAATRPSVLETAQSWDMSATGAPRITEMDGLSPRRKSGPRHTSFTRPQHEDEGPAVSERPSEVTDNEQRVDEAPADLTRYSMLGVYGNTAPAEGSLLEYNSSKSRRADLRDVAGDDVNQQYFPVQQHQQVGGNIQTNDIHDRSEPIYESIRTVSTPRGSQHRPIVSPRFSVPEHDFPPPPPRYLLDTTTRMGSYHDINHAPQQNRIATANAAPTTATQGLNVGQTSRSRPLSTDPRQTPALTNLLQPAESQDTLPPDRFEARSPERLVSSLCQTPLKQEEQHIQGFRQPQAHDRRHQTLQNPPYINTTSEPVRQRAYTTGSQQPESATKPPRAVQYGFESIPRYETPQYYSSQQGAMRRRTDSNSHSRPVSPRFPMSKPLRSLTPPPYTLGTQTSGSQSQYQKTNGQQAQQMSFALRSPPRRPVSLAPATRESGVKIPLTFHPGQRIGHQLLPATLAPAPGRRGPPHLAPAPRVAPAYHPEHHQIQYVQQNRGPPENGRPLEHRRHASNASSASHSGNHSRSNTQTQVGTPSSHSRPHLGPYPPQAQYLSQAVHPEQDPRPGPPLPGPHSLAGPHAPASSQQWPGFETSQRSGYPPHPVLQQQSSQRPAVSAYSQPISTSVSGPSPNPAQFHPYLPIQPNQRGLASNVRFIHSGPRGEPQMQVQIELPMAGAKSRRNQGRRGQRARADAARGISDDAGRGRRGGRARSGGIANADNGGGGNGKQGHDNTQRAAGGEPSASSTKAAGVPGANLGADVSVEKDNEIRLDASSMVRA